MEKKIVLGLVVSIIILTTLAFYTDNPDNRQQQQGKQVSYVEECKPYFLNGVKCPLKENRSVSNLSDSSQTVNNSAG